MTQIKDVHTEHCCMVHGCKYGKKHCPVVIKEKRQSYPCESCEYQKIDPTKSDLETSIYNFKPGTYYQFNLLTEEDKKNAEYTGPTLLYAIDYIQDDLKENHLLCNLYMFRTSPINASKFLSYSSHLECVKAIMQKQWTQISRQEFECIRDKYIKKHPIKKLDF